MGMAFFSGPVPKLVKLLVLAAFGVIIAAILQTGSRGGMIALFIGLLIFALDKHDERFSLKSIAIAIVAIIVFVAAVVSDTATLDRFRLSFEKGSYAQREYIVPQAWNMVEERPVMGWGPFTNYVELGKRMNTPTRDTHNLFLLILTEVGIIGALPYFIGLAGAVQKAWKARSRLQNIVPLVLMASVLAINMGISWQNRKLHWLVIALCIAAYPAYRTVPEDETS
jgi:O-antigen ligase